MVSKRIWVVVEVGAVFLVGSLIARSLLRALGMRGSKQAIHVDTTATHFDAAAVAAPMILRWSLVLGLAVLVGWWAARHRPASYGLTLAGRSWRFHCATGVVVFALIHLPVLVRDLLRHSGHLKGGPPVWQAIAAARWDLDFWLWALASSIVLPVLVEEAFFRGYAQTRLSTAFRPMTAVTMISVVFMLGHSQYTDGSLVGTLTLFLGIWWTLLLGMARLYTGSLVAPMLAHALSNTPMRPQVQVALVPLLIVVVMLARRQLPGALRAVAPSGVSSAPQGDRRRAGA